MSKTFDPYQEWLGLPTTTPNHYELLGVDLLESDPAVIEASAEARMKMLRKYQTGPRGHHTQPLLNRIAVARRCLLDEDSRKLYEQQLADSAPLADSAESPSAAATPPAAATFVEPAPPPIATEPVPPPVGEVEAPPQELRLDKATVREPTPRRRAAGPLWFLAAVVAIALTVWGVGSSLRYLEARGEPEPQPETVPPVVEPEPEVAVLIVQEATGDIHLSAASARRMGDGLELMEGEQGTYIGNWTSLDQQLQWRFKIVAPGVFLVRPRYRTTQPGVRFQLAFERVSDHRVAPIANGRGVLEKEARLSDPPGIWLNEEYFVPLPGQGEYLLTLRPLALAGDTFLQLNEVQLVPNTGPSVQRLDPLPE